MAYSVPEGIATGGGIGAIYKPKPSAPTSSGGSTSGGTSSGGVTAPPPVPSTPSTPAATPGDQWDQIPGLSGANRDAYRAAMSVLDAYGLGSLAKPLLSFAQQGYDESTSYYLIQQSPEWKQRFAGNELLKKAGLAELTPDQYLATEAQYANTLKAAGIPSGMFGPSDFAQWIGNSVAPTEIQQRTQIAANWVNSNDPNLLQALQDYHGIDKGHMIAYALDQSRALPYLNLVSEQAQVGASALRAGLHANGDFAMQLAGMVQNGNLSQHDVDSGYSAIGQTLPRLTDLGHLANQNWDQTSAEKATFLQNPEALHQQLSIVQQEQARFTGTPGLGSNFYHPAYGLGRDMEGAF